MALSGHVGKWEVGGRGWADENTSPTRKRGVGIIPRLRVGLVVTPLVQLLAAISSGQGEAPAELATPWFGRSLTLPSNELVGQSR